MALQCLKELTGNMERDCFQGMEGQDKGEWLPTDRDWVLIGYWEEILSWSVVSPWHRLPREAVAASGSLAVSKTRMDGAWNNQG